MRESFIWFYIMNENVVQRKKGVLFGWNERIYFYGFLNQCTLKYKSCVCVRKRRFHVNGWNKRMEFQYFDCGRYFFFIFLLFLKILNVLFWSACGGKICARIIFFPLVMYFLIHFLKFEIVDVFIMFGFCLLLFYEIDVEDWSVTFFIYEKVLGNF